LSLLLVDSAQVQPGLSSLHLWAGLGGADSLQLGDEEVEFQDELSQVFILPNVDIHFWRRSDDLLDIGGIRAYHW
jgi:hypothetical protein